MCPLLEKKAFCQNALFLRSEFYLLTVKLLGFYDHDLILPNHPQNPPPRGKVLKVLDLFLGSPLIYPEGPQYLMHLYDGSFRGLYEPLQGQHFHSPGIQLPFPAEVGADGLPNLHPALESCPLLAAAELTGI